MLSSAPLLSCLDLHRVENSCMRFLAGSVVLASNQGQMRLFDELNALKPKRLPRQGNREKVPLCEFYCVSLVVSHTSRGVSHTPQ